MSHRTAAVPGADEIRFCTGAGGARLAWSRRGRGPAVLVVSTWFGHVDVQRADRVWQPFLDALAGRATVVRFDERGTGYSDCVPTSCHVEAWLDDVDAVADAAGLDDFVLLGIGAPGGCGSSVAIAYAAQRPARVRALVVYGGSASPPLDPAGREMFDALRPLIPIAWAREDRVVHRLFTSLCIPDSTEQQKRDLDEMIFRTSDASGGVAAANARAEFVVRPLLGDVRVPTLVVHAVDDGVVQFSQAQILAAEIPDARLVPLRSVNHVVLPHEPAWRILVDEITAFVAAADAPVAARPPDRAPRPGRDVADLLSPRERDVLQLVSSGADNEAVAAQLFLSVRTVERHLHNVYVKLGLGGKSARAAAVARLLRSE